MQLPKVYLDQNHWVNLARAASSPHSPESHRQALQVLRNGVDGCMFEVVLSATNYLELWHRNRWSSRHDIAKLMAELSGFRSIAPIHSIIRWELEAAAIGASLPPVRDRAFGSGANHAFASATGRFRLVERAWSPTEPEGAPTHEGSADLLFLQYTHSRMWEWLNLAGFPSDSGPLGEGPDGPWPEHEADLRPEHRHGTRDAHDEAALIDWIRSVGLEGDIRSVVVMNNLMDNREVILGILKAAGIPAQRLTDSAWRALHDSCWSLWTNATLRALRLEDPSFPIEQYDRTDLLSLSTCVPYCDVVLTEKRLAHLANRAGCYERFGTFTLGRTSDIKRIPGLILERARGRFTD
ncbi:MAG: hypothetical protein JWM47_1544 [Acidimicrobiales bacterium]|nr:hypothetical protein [Acidimicrobiales bacterium]